MGTTGSRRETLIVGFLCAAWYMLSSASNVVGKLALTELPFPLTMTAVQLCAVASLSVPALALCGVRSTRWPTNYWTRVLVPLAIAKLLTTLCSQVSIWKVPVSYAHTVKATTPLWTAGLARVLFGERVSRGVAGALLVIAGGVALASLTELQFDALGLGAALTSAALLALQHLYSKRALQDSGVHHLRLLATLSGLALVPMAPLWLVRDAGAVLRAQVAWNRAGPLLLADGVLAWLQAVAAFSVLSRVSPLTYSVASAAKRAVVVGASLVVLRNPAPPLNVVGMSVAVLGVLAYDRARAAARRAPRPALPV
ncbi:solute carrier family 35 member E1 homolog [Bombyx mandarina]|uniref:Solute carrier family 35 member E1 homolog n=1 Tax=Bombyx mandarina TaxID=7092 RepID=A0A6J2K262_BOMMA|nr:solute carrier family 35 member E1 homolog [Bombyx mandarina]